jgi:hypothetical protein
VVFRASSPSDCGSESGRQLVASASASAIPPAAVAAATEVAAAGIAAKVDVGTGSSRRPAAKRVSKGWR